ncbi:beta-galactosidase [candidate division KSB1 bacterium]|nr:beta-galactosidase [candidate division KSB1 bacterium]
MKTKILVILCLIPFTLGFAQGQADYYGIYFKTFPWTIVEYPEWVDAVVSDWGATGVQLEAVWRIFEPDRSDLEADPIYTWTQFDQSLDTLINKGVDISFRVRIGSLLPDWVDFKMDATSASDGLNHVGLFDKEDFHIGDKGNHIWKGQAPLSNNNSNRYFNLTSKKGIETMTRFYEDVVKHIKEYLIDSGRYGSDRRPIEIIPTVNLVGEMELNSDWNMTGYSPIEIDSFRVYLVNKYLTIDRLNSRWCSNFSNFSDINSIDSSWRWHEYKNMSFKDYTYPPGRLDWLNFKFKQSKKMVDRFAKITKKYGFKMGVQLGCLHDYRLDFRGFYDPTSLLGRAYAFRLADIKGYKEVFAFGANYARSICEYWDWKWKDGERRGFTSETNNHMYGYVSGDSADYARELASIWADQVESYYDRGADIHVIAGGWGNSQDREGFFINGSLLVKDSTIQSWYEEFRTVLQEKKGTNRQTVINNKAIHLSTNCYLIIANRSSENIFFLYNSVKPDSDYIDPSASYQDDGCDIVTNYMIIYDPGYLNKYNNFSLTKSSKYMSDEVYLSLMRTDIDDNIVNIRNATAIYDNGHGEFKTTPGLRNEIDKERISPIHLIWRSRRDLKIKFPDSNR